MADQGEGFPTRNHHINGDRSQSQSAAAGLPLAFTSSLIPDEPSTSAAHLPSYRVRSDEHSPIGMQSKLQQSYGTLVPARSMPYTSQPLQQMTSRPAMPVLDSQDNDSFFAHRSTSPQQFRAWSHEQQRFQDHIMTMDSHLSPCEGVEKMYYDAPDFDTSPYNTAMLHYGRSIEAFDPGFETQGICSVGPNSDPPTTDPDDELANSYQCYAKLIYQCLSSAQNHTMALRDIYQWVFERSPKLQVTIGDGWKNSVRHNLSMNAAFEKVKSAVGPKKNSLWKLSDEAYRNQKVLSTTRYRKAAGRKTHRNGPRPETSSKRQQSGAKGGQATRESARRTKLDRNQINIGTPIAEYYYGRSMVQSPDAMTPAMTDPRISTPHPRMPSAGSPFIFEPTPSWAQSPYHPNDLPLPHPYQCLPVQQQQDFNHEATAMYYCGQTGCGNSYLNNGCDAPPIDASPHPTEAPNLTPNLTPGELVYNGDCVDDDTMTQDLFPGIDSLPTYYANSNQPAYPY